LSDDVDRLKLAGAAASLDGPSGHLAMQTSHPDRKGSCGLQVRVPAIGALRPAV